MGPHRAPNIIYTANSLECRVRLVALADHVEVENAQLELGMLNIHLKRNIPEELQPKKIKINEGVTIEGKKGK